jgi:hypothetical protein
MLTAYAGTFGVPFIFDDIAAVTQNPSLHRLVDALTPPPDLSVSGRPLANLSLAANYLAGGTAVAGYHSINLALHVACAWLIFGAVRRAAIFVGASATAVPLAASTALIWALHPLATAAVTYVMQRTELLVSCGALATVYAFVRSDSAPCAAGRSHPAPRIDADGTADSPPRVLRCTRRHLAHPWGTPRAVAGARGQRRGGIRNGVD